MFSTSATLDAGSYSFLKLSKNSVQNGMFYINLKIFDTVTSSNSIHENRFFFNMITEWQVWKLENDSELFKTHSDDEYVYIDIVLEHKSSIRLGTNADEVALYPVFTGFELVTNTKPIELIKTDMPPYGNVFTFDSTVKEGNFVYILEGLEFDSEVKPVKQIITGSRSGGTTSALHYELNTTCSENNGVFTIRTNAYARCYANVHWDK